MGSRFRSLCAAAALSLLGCNARTLPAPSATQGPERLACRGGATLPTGRSIIGSTRGAADLLRGSCVRGAAPECVYVLELDRRASVRIGIESTGFDGALVLLGASGDPDSELACSDDLTRGDTHHSRIDRILEPGRYNVVVDGIGGESGDFELFAQVDPLPSVKNVCEQADLLQEGMSFRGRTTGAPNQFMATCAGGAGGPDHVHAFDLSVASRVRFRQQTDYDGALYVRSSCEDPSSEQACNDDLGDGTRSALALRLPTGRHYLITDAYAREQHGNYVVSYERVDEPALREVSQVCRESELLPVRPGSFEVDTLAAPSVMEGSCGGRDAPEVAFHFEVAQRSELRAEVVDPELNVALYVRERCSAPESELICFRAQRVDKSSPNKATAPSALLVTLEPGAYTLVFDGAEAEDLGAARLVTSLTPVEGMLLPLLPAKP